MDNGDDNNKLRERKAAVGVIVEGGMIHGKQKE